MSQPDSELRPRASSALPVCHTLWIGGALGLVARGCLMSFLEAGHEVRLHAYEAIPDVPPGVEVVDAAALLPADQIIRHRKTGSVSLFSNRFRYEILERLGGIWIDADVLCVRPVPAKPYTFGWEHSRSINGAVLGVPSGSPLLEDLRAVFTTKDFMPPYFPWKTRQKYGLRRRFRREFHLGDMMWGTAGPQAITYYAKLHGVAKEAQPIEVFYPVSMIDVEHLHSPSGNVGQFITERTLCIHLWNTGGGRRSLQPGSFMWRIAEGTWREVLPV
jgi:hypothetical protein